MKKILFILLTTLFVFSCDDIGKGYKWQGDIPPGFSRNFGTVGYDYGWSAAYSPFDEGIVLIGERSTEVNGESDLWAIKTNSRGIIEWEKTFGGNSKDVGLDVIATSDGGFLFVGYTWSFGNRQQVYSIKTDYYGNKEWERNYGASMWDVGNAVIEVDGGGYLIAGYSNSPGISSGNTDMYLIKLDLNGNLVWEKAYGNPTAPNHEWAFDLIQISDGSIILVGARDRYNKGSTNNLIIRLDKDGDLIWEKEIFDNEQIEESIYSISQSINGALYLCSTSNSMTNPGIFKPNIIKMDISGNIEWNRSFNANGNSNHQFRATSTALGDIIIVGSSYQIFSTGIRSDAFMTKIDESGNIIWTNSYGSSDYDDWGWSVFETPKSSLVFIGSTKSFGASLFDIYLVGTNSEGILY